MTDLYERVHELLRRPAFEAEAFQLAIAPLLPFITWNTKDRYTAMDVAVAIAMATSKYKGNFHDAFTNQLDEGTARGEPFIIPSDDTMLRRLVKQDNPRDTTFGLPVRHDMELTRDMLRDAMVAQANLGIEMADWKQRDIYGVHDGSPSPDFATAEHSEAWIWRKPEMRGHGSSPIPFYRGTAFSLGFHCCSLYDFVRKSSFMIQMEFDRPANLREQIERGLDAYDRLNERLFGLVVDRYYTQSSELMDVYQDRLNRYDTWVTGPKKMDAHTERVVQEGWGEVLQHGKGTDNPYFFRNGVDARWWYCRRTNWSQYAKGHRSFYTGVFYQAMPSWYDEDEEGGHVVQASPEFKIVGFPVWLNKELDAASAPRVAQLVPRRWGTESFFGRQKHELGRSQASYLFPRQFMAGATYMLANSYTLWRIHHQNRLGTTELPEELGLKRFKNQVRARGRQYLFDRGLEDLADDSDTWDVMER